MTVSFLRRLAASLSAMLSAGLLVMLMWAGPTPAWSADEAAPKKRVVTDLIMKGDARCTRCHSDVNGDEVESYPVLPIARTKHGTRADGRTPSCVNCHGDSERHLKQEGKLRPLPDRPFGKKMAANDPLAHNQACMSCHEGGKLMHWGGSTHSRRDVPCTDCHQLHVEHDRATKRETVAQSCMSCHKEKRAEFGKPNHHPVPEGTMVCTDCHNPHGSAGPKLMVKDSVNETCFTCHAQHRGPFVWNHLPVTQDCSICHNPHGTTTTGLLKMRPPFLCQQCHEPANHRGNFTSVNGVQNNSPPGSGGTTQARGCVNCHNQIHGGSNPTSTGTQRTFRR
jgi:DmsE family decaheme c-type cytochrome